MPDENDPAGDSLPDLVVDVGPDRHVLQALPVRCVVGVGEKAELQLPRGRSEGAWASFLHAGHWMVVAEEGTELWCDGVQAVPVVVDGGSEASTLLDLEPGERQIRLVRGGQQVDLAASVRPPRPITEPMTGPITEPRTARDRIRPDQVLVPTLSMLLGRLRAESNPGLVDVMGEARGLRRRRTVDRVFVIERVLVHSGGVVVRVPPGKDGRPVGATRTKTVHELVDPGDGTYPEPILDQGWAVTYKGGRWLTWSRELTWGKGLKHAPEMFANPLAELAPFLEEELAVEPQLDLWQQPGQTEAEDMSFMLTEAFHRLRGLSV